MDKKQFKQVLKTIEKATLKINRLEAKKEKFELQLRAAYDYLTDQIDDNFWASNSDHHSHQCPKHPSKL